MLKEIFKRLTYKRKYFSIILCSVINSIDFFIQLVAIMLNISSENLTKLSPVSIYTGSL